MREIWSMPNQFYARPYEIEHSSYFAAAGENVVGWDFKLTAFLHAFIILKVFQLIKDIYLHATECVLFNMIYLRSLFTLPI